MRCIAEGLAPVFCAIVRGNGCIFAAEGRAPVVHPFACPAWDAQVARVRVKHDLEEVPYNFSW